MGISIKRYWKPMSYRPAVHKTIQITELSENARRSDHEAHTLWYDISSNLLLHNAVHIRYELSNWL